MGNSSNSKAVKPSKDTDKNTQYLKQDPQEGYARNDKNDIHQLPQKPIEVKSKEHLSNEDIDTDQQPQKSMQGVLEGYESNGQVNRDMLPQHWRHHVRKEPTVCLTSHFSYTPSVLTDIDNSNEDIDTDQQPQKSMQGVLEGYESNGQVNIDMLPQHWRHHVRKEPTVCLTSHSSYTPSGLTDIDNSFRDDVKWFFDLLAAYNQQKHNILEFLSKSNSIEETIRCPDNMDDKAFDDFARECTETNLETPSFWTKTTMKQKLFDCIEKCLEKKRSLIEMGPILKEHNRLILEVQNLKEKNEELQKLQAKEQKRQKKKSKKYLKRFHDQVEQENVLAKEDSEEFRKQIDSLNENQSNFVKENDQALRQEEMSKKDSIRVHDQVEQEREKVQDLKRQLKKIAEEKENLLTRLSKIAGSKLTTNNPDIADLNDDYRPTKLAEKFGQLYDDAWTDSIEELTGGERRVDDRTAISILLRIVMTAYQFCSDSRSMFLDLTDCQTIVTCKDTGGIKDITKLPDALTPDIQQAIKLCLRAKGTTLISETKEKFTNTLNCILSEITRVKGSVSINPLEQVKDETRMNKPSDYCLHDVKTAHLQNKDIEDNLQSTKKSKKRQQKVSHSESVDSSQTYNEPYFKDKCLLKTNKFCGQLGTPTFFQTSSPPQFAKTTLFAERCVELCWYMQTTRPPIHLSACIPYDGKMNNDIFRAYTKSGKKVDYIVWPVMYLYENGPVLNKGIAQPK